MLNISDKAPLDINVLDSKGKEVNLRQFLGQKIVLYFYPKDNTPGCTKEACDFRDYSVSIEELGAIIIGVSADSTASHNKFADKHSLPFELWSDSENKLSEAFGVYGKKSIFGKVGFGLSRSTFILNENGEIIKVWPKVNVTGHTEEVIQFLKDYNNKTK